MKNDNNMVDSKNVEKLNNFYENMIKCVRFLKYSSTIYKFDVSIKFPFDYVKRKTLILNLKKHFSKISDFENKLNEMGCQNITDSFEFAILLEKLRIISIELKKDYNLIKEYANKEYFDEFKKIYDNVTLYFNIFYEKMMKEMLSLK